MYQPDSATQAHSQISNIEVDNMTGLGNFFAFLKTVKQELLALRTPASYKLAVALFDIDSTSRIQQAIGRQATDYVISTIASALYRAMPPDLVSRGAMQLFRIADDEFALVMRFADCYSAKALVRSMQQAVARLKWEPYARPIKVSTSMACYPTCAESLGELLSFANHFLHHNRNHKGGGLTCVGGPKQKDTIALAMAMSQNATSLVEHLTDQILNTAAQLQQTTHLAMTDPLTELPNLRAARQVLQHYVLHSHKNGAPLGVVMVDGDRLKEYNQLFGYEAGNEMICWLGETLRQYCGETGFVARWLSGDEFLMLLPSLNLAQCKAQALDLCNQIAQDSRHLAIPITVSVGVASYPESGDSADKLIAAVEQANRRAKDAGRNQVCD